MKKPYPKNSLENIVTYCRKQYCFTKNNSKIVKWVKRKMNKRFRNNFKHEEIN